MSSVCLAVRLFVRPSVALVDCDHIGWKSWKLIARTIGPTASFFVAQRSYPPTPRGQGTWGNFGDTIGGVGKSDVLVSCQSWSTKAAILSETGKKLRKVTMERL